MSGLVGVLRRVMESVAHSDVTRWQQLTSRLDLESRILPLPLSGCDLQQVQSLPKPWGLALQDITSPHPPRHTPVHLCSLDCIHHVENLQQGTSTGNPARLGCDSGNHSYVSPGKPSLPFSEGRAVVWGQSAELLERRTQHLRFLHCEHHRST